MSMWFKPVEWFINMSILLSIIKKLSCLLHNCDNFFVKIKLKKAMGFAFQLKYKYGCVFCILVPIALFASLSRLGPRHEKGRALGT